MPTLRSRLDFVRRDGIPGENAAVVLAQATRYPLYESFFPGRVRDGSVSA